MAAFLIASLVSLSASLCSADQTDLLLEKLVEKDEAAASVLSKDEEEKIKKIFEDAINDKNTTVQLEALATDELPVTMVCHPYVIHPHHWFVMPGINWASGCNHFIKGSQINALRNIPGRICATPEGSSCKHGVYL